MLTLSRYDEATPGTVGALRAEYSLRIGCGVGYIYDYKIPFEHLSHHEVTNWLRVHWLCIAHDLVYCRLKGSQHMRLVEESITSAWAGTLHGCNKPPQRTISFAGLT